MFDTYSRLLFSEETITKYTGYSATNPKSGQQDGDPGRVEPAAQEVPGHLFAPDRYM